MRAIHPVHGEKKESLKIYDQGARECTVINMRGT